jgi:hypothetical protein
MLKNNFGSTTLVARKLTDLSQEKEWAKSAENIGASPLKEDLPIDATSGRIHLVRQSLEILNVMLHIGQNGELVLVGRGCTVTKNGALFLTFSQKYCCT